VGTTSSKDGTAIAFDRLGDGPPVILVHPAFGHRSFNPEMAALAELLAARFTVFNYDRRGRGESGDTAPYAVEREIDDLDALIGEAGGSAYVYGMSSGAALALEAANQGLAITKLALYEAPFVVDDTRRPVPAGYLARLTELVSSNRRGDVVEHFMTNGVGVPAEMVAQMRNQPMWPAFEAVAHTLVYDGTILDGTMDGHPLPAERVASVKVPTLVIVGTAAPAWSQNSTKALADALPRARVRTLQGEFHAVPPAILAPALEEFFAG
jgi:pimeloyl-ACP methyl ester carboxylesterase